MISEHWLHYCLISTTSLSVQITQFQVSVILQIKMVSHMHPHKNENVVPSFGFERNNTAIINFNFEHSRKWLTLMQSFIWHNHLLFNYLINKNMISYVNHTRHFVTSLFILYCVFEILNNNFINIVNIEIVIMYSNHEYGNLNIIKTNAEGIILLK